MGEKKLPLPPPLLLTTHGEHESPKQSFYSLLENRYHTTCVPVLRNKSVLCSAYGWLVLLDGNRDSDSAGECCLWNPSSLETIQIPEVELPHIYNICFLSKPPTHPDCFVIFNCVGAFGQLFYRIQDNAIFRINFAKQEVILMSMVSFQGTVYGVVHPFHESKNQFVTIHAEGDELEARPLLIDDKLPWEVPQGIRSWNLQNHVYLMESPCGNELLLVTRLAFNVELDSNMQFRVFRVDVDRMECEELDNLDGLTVFIGYYGNGFCRSSDSLGTTIKPNSIYYTGRNGSAVYVYDLDDRSIISLLPYKDSGIDPYTAKNFWVDLPYIPMKNTSLYFR